MSQQYSVPQNIEVEDKILGPFTLKQFLYMIGGGMSVYLLFLIVAPISFTLFTVIALPISLITLALVFVKIGERPFITFIGYFITFTNEPKIKTWQKSTRIKSIMVQSREEAAQGKKDIAKRTKEGLVRSRLEELAMIVDTKGWSGGESVVSKDRVISAPNVLSTVKMTIKDTEPLDDVFEDLEMAMENLQAPAEKKIEDDEFKDLAINLSNLLSKK